MLTQNRRRWWFVLLWAALLLGRGAQAQTNPCQSFGCPDPPPYPYWGPDNTWTRQQVIDEAQRMSDCLAAYVNHWFERGRPANEAMTIMWPDSNWDDRTWDNPSCNGKQMIPSGLDPQIGRAHV